MRGLTALQLLLVGFVRHLANVNRHCSFDFCLSLFHPVMQNLEELLGFVVTHHQFVEGILQGKDRYDMSVQHNIIRDVDAGTVLG